MGDDHFRNLQSGTIVNGRYEVVKGLGAGSMGMVYACRDRELGGRLVAMKVLFSEVAADKVATARFKNEIFASYAVNHPNVVRAYEYFVDRDLIAYTMEYVGGGDLAERIGGEELIEISDIIKMLTQMCCGVFAIHKEGIIHRDLKPENILITSQGDIKITDFGIARCGSGPKLTEHGGVVGTIDYVSPEYLELGHVDARSDIYAVGVLGYEMITGKAPFSGQSVIETMTMRLRTDPRPPVDLRENCPVALSNIILYAMRRNPAERYQSAEEIIVDLDTLSKSNYARQVGANVNGGMSVARSEGGSPISDRSGGQDMYCNTYTDTGSGGGGSLVAAPSGRNLPVGYRPVYSGAPPSSPSRPAPSYRASAPSSVPAPVRRAPSSHVGAGGMQMVEQGQVYERNAYSSKGARRDYGHEIDERRNDGSEDRRPHPSLTQRAPEQDLGKMARSQLGPQTLNTSSFSNTQSEEELYDLEVEDSVVSQVFFWICVMVLGFVLGSGCVYAFSYAQKASDASPKSPSSTMSRPYR